MLEIRDLNVYYGDAQALWNVSLRLDEGEIVAIVGSNGAGKTTLLNTVAGILRPRTGSIRMLGVDVTQVRPERVCEYGIALVPEGRRLFSGLTVRENLLLGAYSARARPHRERTLEEVQEIFPILRERARQLAGTLSGGQQQMVAIARALMARPKLLLLDEPSLGLSPKMVDAIFDVMKRINELGVSILLVEQNVGRALEIADRGYVLEQGRIVREGKPDELLRDDGIRRAYLAHG